MGLDSSLGKKRQAPVFDLQRASRGIYDQTCISDAWTRGERCLVVTDGFYEWKKLDAKGKFKRPYAIAMAGDDAQMVIQFLQRRL